MPLIGSGDATGTTKWLSIDDTGAIVLTGFRVGPCSKVNAQDDYFFAVAVPDTVDGIPVWHVFPALIKGSLEVLSDGRTVSFISAFEAGDLDLNYVQCQLVIEGSVLRAVSLVVQDRQLEWTDYTDMPPLLRLDPALISSSPESQPDSLVFPHDISDPVSVSGVLVGGLTSTGADIGHLGSADIMYPVSLGQATVLHVFRAWFDDTAEMQSAQNALHAQHPQLVTLQLARSSDGLLVLDVQ